ncbi:MAG: sulfatase-like hydrolase/transferase [Planctomycetes bacterium]|nr:sulfatase-like hydrolase/transferase [Planctomycetota bacterium]
MRPLQDSPGEPRGAPSPNAVPGGPATAASARTGFLVLFVLLCGWKHYSLATGNFRIQETWSRWDYALTYPQDLCLFFGLYVIWDLLGSRRGRALLAITIVTVLCVTVFQLADARMKVRFLHPLSVDWLRYAVAEAQTIGPDYAVFTGNSFWVAALASLCALVLAFASPWVPVVRAVPLALHRLGEQAFVRRGTRALFVLFAILVVFTPAVPYGLQRNFVLASLFPLDRPVVGYDRHETRETEAPVRLSSASSYAHTVDPALALCRGRNVVLYVIESLAREQTSLSDPDSGATPNLARALAQGGVQTSCYAQFANSSKATFGLLSGVFAAQTMEVLECEMPTMTGLPRAFGDAGYFSACITPQHLYYQGQRTMFRRLGFVELAAFLDLQALARDRGEPFDDVGPRSKDDRLMFLWDHSVLPARQPFFVTYYTMSSHYRYDFPGQTKGSDEERHERAVRYTDQVIGEILAEYQRLGLYENTLFVFTADHGEDFQGGRFAPRHSSLLENAHDVPLLFFAPGVDLSGLRLGRARQVDLLPTLLDLTGLSPAGLPMSGESLLFGDKARTVFLQSYGTERTRALIDGTQKWIWDVDSGVRWTADLAADPRGRSPRRVGPDSDPREVRAAEEAVGRMERFAIYNEAYLRDLVAGHGARPR